MVPARSDFGAALEAVRPTLRAYRQRLAGQPGPPRGRGAGAFIAGLSAGAGCPVDAALAHVLDGLRRAVRLRRGTSLAGRSLSVRTAMSRTLPVLKLSLGVTLMA